MLLRVYLQGFESPQLHPFFVGITGDFLRLFPKTVTLFPSPHRWWEFCLPQGLLLRVDSGNIGNMTAKAPKLLDLFCCQGGAGMGYHRAGFDVVGVDISPQPRYPFPFHQRDAVDFLRVHGKRFDAVHASPPCQAFTNAQKLMGNEHPDFITPTRELLHELGKPFIIENVPGSPLENPVEMCGAMFGLGTYRHRLFETNWELTAPAHPAHLSKTTKMGRKPVDGEMMHVVGNFSGVAKAKQAMGIDWMNRDGLRESIPPAYTQWIGAQLIEQVTERQVAA